MPIKNSKKKKKQKEFASNSHFKSPYLEPAFVQDTGNTKVNKTWLLS